MSLGGDLLLVLLGGLQAIKGRAGGNAHLDQPALTVAVLRNQRRLIGGM